MILYFSASRLRAKGRGTFEVSLPFLRFSTPEFSFGRNFSFFLIFCPNYLLNSIICCTFAAIFVFNTKNTSNQYVFNAENTKLIIMLNT